MDHYLNPDMWALIVVVGALVGLALGFVATTVVSPRRGGRRGR